MRKAAMLGLIAAAVLSLGAADGVVATSDSATAGSLIIEARPLQSAVRLDGVPIGMAHDLVARPVYVRPGGHVLSVSAPGFLPSVSRWTSGPRGAPASGWTWCPTAAAEPRGARTLRSPDGAA